MNISENLCNVLHKIGYQFTISRESQHLQLSKDKFRELLRKNDYNSWKLGRVTLTQTNVDNALFELHEYVYLQKNEINYEALCDIQNEIVFYQYPNACLKRSSDVIPVYVDKLYVCNNDIPRIKLLSMYPHVSVSQNIRTRHYKNSITKPLQFFQISLSNYDKTDYNLRLYKYGDPYNNWTSYVDVYGQNEGLLYDDDDDDDSSVTSSVSNDVNRENDICAFKLWIPKYLYYKIYNNSPSKLIKNDEIFMNYKYHPDTIRDCALADTLFADSMLYKPGIDFSNEH